MRFALRTILLAFLLSAHSLFFAAATPPDFIVSFHKLASLAAHQLSIENVLKATPYSWSFRPRTNRAHTFPSDFVVLTVSHPTAVTSLLKSSIPSIRSIHADVGSAVPRIPLASVHWDNQAFNGGARLNLFGTGEIWKLGYTGAGVKVAVFDTGLGKGFEAVANVAERTDWTGEDAPDDRYGHGTIIAGLIGGQHPHCPGIAPAATIYSMRLFTKNQVSYTSWFLDAFNYALHIGVDIINLSIGGPDFADEPFVDKVNQLTAAGVIFVSAIGNDGPRWGTLNNPADMLDVVGVGGVDPDGTISRFSSRGFTAHHMNAYIPRRSYGRVKPDLVAYARNLMAPSHTDVGSCRKLSGTSVSSPVVAGAIALIISVIPIERRNLVANPAAVKRALMESAKLLHGSSMYEQGAGLLDIPAAVATMLEIDREFLALQNAHADLLALEQSQTGAVQLQAHLERAIRKRKEAEVAKRRSRFFSPHSILFRDVLNSISSFSSPLNGDYTQRKIYFAKDYNEHNLKGFLQGPRAYVFPERIDLVSGYQCTVTWPHCSQPLFPGSETQTLNLSIYNLAGMNAQVVEVTWTPVADSGTDVRFLGVSVTIPQRFWPWTGGLGVHLRATDRPMEKSVIEEGFLEITVVTTERRAFSKVKVPMRVEIVPKPPRSKRILWDLFHSLKYPPGYVPADSLTFESKDMLDWLGDHPHTNFRRLYNALRRRGYFVDILDRPLACLGGGVGGTYGALIIIDSEDYFFQEERNIIENAVEKDGLVLIVAAEWYNTKIMKDIRFNDDNTRSRWTPIMGGGNIPALNMLLRSFHISFSTNQVISGNVSIEGYRPLEIDTGVPITSFPKHGEIISANTLAVMYTKPRSEKTGLKRRLVYNMKKKHAVIGIAAVGEGTVVALSDSHGFDGAYKKGGRSVKLFADILDSVIEPGVARQRVFKNSRLLTEAMTSTQQTYDPLAANAFALFVPHSRVLTLESTIDVPKERPLLPICEKYDELVSQVSVLEYEEKATVSFDIGIRAHATVVGSEAKYYTSLQKSIPELAKRYEEEKEKEYKRSENMIVILASTLAVVVGVMLLILSFITPNRKNFQSHRQTSVRSPRWRMLGRTLVKKWIARFLHGSRDE